MERGWWEGARLGGEEGWASRSTAKSLAAQEMTISDGNPESTQPASHEIGLSGHAWESNNVIDRRGRHVESLGERGHVLATGRRAMGKGMPFHVTSPRLCPPPDCTAA